MIKKSEVLKIINNWYYGLHRTSGIIVLSEKVCSNYDLQELIDEIKLYPKKKEPIIIN